MIPPLKNFREELAWAAGFFDGEGYVGHMNHLDKRDGRLYSSPKLSVGQVRREPLNRFALAVGVGSVRGPYGPYKGQVQPIHAFRLEGFEKVQAMAAMLWVFLSEPKREQFNQVLTASRAGCKRHTGGHP